MSGFYYPIRARETTSTVGTGYFVLTGAVAMHRTFVSAFGLGVGDGDSRYLYYVYEDPVAGEWEYGYGYHETVSSEDRIYRSVVLANSSGTTSALSVTNAGGAAEVYAVAGASALNPIKIGVDDSYYTEASTYNIKPGDVGLNRGWMVLSRYNNINATDAYALPGAIVYGSGTRFGSGNETAYYTNWTQKFLMHTTTVDATQTTMHLGHFNYKVSTPVTADGIDTCALYTNTTYYVFGKVFAEQNGNTTPTYAVFDVAAMVVRNSNGSTPCGVANIETSDSTTPTYSTGTGASGWLAGFTHETSQYLRLKVTGAAATRINWVASLEMIAVDTNTFD